LKKSRNIVVCLILISGLSAILSTDSFAQGQDNIIQFSGVIVGQDTTSGVPGVHIYVPKAGRGTTSNLYGYFSLPVLVRDSIVVSAVGYKKQHFIIPADKGPSITAIIELAEDTTYLPTIEVLPFPTEELFKEAILAMNLPMDPYANSNYLGDEVLAQMLRNMPMDATTNYKVYMEQQFYQMHNRNSYQDPLMAITNPFAWSKFIQAIKRGDFKRKK
jgi:hypothetical protein